MVHAAPRRVAHGARDRRDARRAGAGRCARSSPRATSSSRTPASRLQLVRGPFRELEGQWPLTPIGDVGLPRRAASCASRSPIALSGALFEPLFEHTAASLVDAFVAARAKARAGVKRAASVAPWCSRLPATAMLCGPWMLAADATVADALAQRARAGGRRSTCPGTRRRRDLRRAVRAHGRAARRRPDRDLSAAQPAIRRSRRRARAARAEAARLRPLLEPRLRRLRPAAGSARGRATARPPVPAARSSCGPWPLDARQLLESVCVGTPRFSTRCTLSLRNDGQAALRGCAPASGSSRVVPADRRRTRRAPSACRADSAPGCASCRPAADRWSRLEVIALLDVHAIDAAGRGEQSQQQRARRTRWIVASALNGG